MRSITAVAAVAALASSVAAYEYEEDIFAREADAEPIFGLNHAGKWVGNMFGSVKAGYDAKAHRDDYYRKRDLEELEEYLATRDAEAEPIFGLNHAGKWVGNIFGSVKAGYDAKAHRGDSYSKRDLEELEEYLATRDADAEPIFGLNHAGKWVGNIFGSVKAGYDAKAHRGDSYSKRDLEELEEYLAARDAEAEAGTISNAVSGWAGGLANTITSTVNSKGWKGNTKTYTSNTGTGNVVSTTSSFDNWKRDIEDLEDMLAARDAEAEPIFGLNHAGKWLGNIAGSVVGGFKDKAGGRRGGGYGGDAAYERRSLDDDELLEALYARYADDESYFEEY